MPRIEILLILLLAVGSARAEERYRPDDGPPQTGWRSAIKYFQKGTTAQTSVSGGGSDASVSQLIFLDNIFFVNNREGSKMDLPAVWGLKLGYEWDAENSWYGKGLYLQHTDYDLERRFSLLGGFYFPTFQSAFPLYLKANAGLGYFVGRFDSETLTVDYNLYTGLRIFTRSGMLFNIEMGSVNYSRLMSRSYMNSFVLSSGLAFAF